MLSYLILPRNSRFPSQNIFLGSILQKLLPMFIMVELTPRLLAKHLTNLSVIMLISDIMNRVPASSLFLKERQMLIVTSSKVSIKPKHSRPMGMASSSGLEPKVWVQYACEKFSDVLHIPIKNKFQALKNSQENTFETQGNAPSGLDGTVTASAVPRRERI